MAKNDYARLLAENKRLKSEAVILTHALQLMRQWSAQFFLDLVTITLADGETMGKDTFGPARLERINAKLNALYDEYSECLENKQESDYKREVIDRRLRQICGDKATSWDDRYEGWNI